MKPLDVKLKKATVLAILRGILDEPDTRDPDFGLEGNLIEKAGERVAQDYLMPLTTWFLRVAKQWDGHSGDDSWPIPAPDGTPARTYALKAYPLGEEYHWSGAYGEKQKELAVFLINYLREQHEGYDFGLTDYHVVKRKKAAYKIRGLFFRRLTNFLPMSSKRHQQHPRLHGWAQTRP